MGILYATCGPLFAIGSPNPGTGNCSIQDQSQEVELRACVYSFDSPGFTSASNLEFG